jgi:hypothetical protein
MVCLVFILASVWCLIEGLEVVGNYKFWDSISGNMIYDYSGYHNHGKYSSQNFYFTDRGIMLYGDCILEFPSRDLKEYPGYKDFTLSYWYLRKNNQISRLFFIQYTIDVIRIFFQVTDSGTVIMVKPTLDTLLHTYTFSSPDLLDKWRLYTFKVSQNSSNTQSTITIYIDLNLITSFPVTNASLDSQSYISIGAASHLYGIVYEIWWHKDVSNISELDYLLVFSSGCGCSYGCVTSPITKCLPIYDGKSNYQGQSCSPICSDSCNQDFECIDKSKVECTQGLYHRESGSCLFYCPDYSCICSSSLNCTCKIGYKKVSDDPPACIQSQCISYESKDYKYTCHECETGYILDSLGEFCVCDESFTSVSSDPLICINIPRCLAYMKEGDNYLCSICAEGYTIDSDGNCNECDTDYTKVSLEPLVCLKSIENCIEYSLIYQNIGCQKCKFGYILSSSGMCDDCEYGYIKVSSNTVICKLLVRNCIEYDLTSEDSKCTLCEVGYELDTSYMCNICEVNYFPIAYEPLTCIRVIENCKEYTLNDKDWVCRSCETGFYTSETDFYTCVPSIDSSSECSSDTGNCSSETIDSNSNNYITNSSDVISDYRIDRSETIETYSIVATSLSTYITFLGSVSSFDPSNFIRYMNDVKLLSYIIFLNISLPYEIQIEKKASLKSLERMNILSYIKIQDKNMKDILNDSIDDEYGFISKITYELIGFIMILMLNLILYLLKRYPRGKVKALGTRGVQYFSYTPYIQFFMIIYLDVSYYALNKISNVTITQPKETHLLNVLDYDFAVLLSVIFN